MNTPSGKIAKKIGLVAWVVGVAALLLPFVFVGESWGMVWFYAAAPLSFIAEEKIGIGSDSYFLIGAVSILSAAWWALIVYAIGSVVSFMIRKKTFNQPPQTTPVSAPR